jgi:cell division initiation protein
MTLSKIDVLNKKFSRGLFGYSRAKVDQFLQEAAEALGVAAEERKEAAKNLKRLEALVAEYKQRDETLRETLLSTQRMVDELKMAAGREAELILAEARVKAEAALREGHNRLAEIHDEIEALKRQRSRFQVELKALVETHLRLLETDDPALERIEALESKLKFLKKVE